MRQVGPVLAVIAVALVAAIGVIVYHTAAPTELLAKPHPFVKNGDCSCLDLGPRQRHRAGAVQGRDCRGEPASDLCVVCARCVQVSSMCPAASLRLVPASRFPREPSS